MNGAPRSHPISTVQLTGAVPGVTTTHLGKWTLAGLIGPPAITRGQGRGGIVRWWRTRDARRVAALAAFDGRVYDQWGLLEQVDTHGTGWLIAAASHRQDRRGCWVHHSEPTSPTEAWDLVFPGITPPRDARTTWTDLGALMANLHTHGIGLHLRVSITLDTTGS